MTAPMLHPSLWAAATPPGPDLPRLEGEATADIVIVGGGFTGLSAALAAVEAGRSVILVDASEPGYGASGRTNGQVIPTLSRPDPDQIIAAWGEAGERFVRMMAGSAAFLFDTVRRLDIACEAEQTGWLQPAHTPNRIRISERRVAQWSRFGADVALLTREEMSAALGSDQWFGGWTARTGGHVNPLALCRGMARALIAKGVRIFGRSPVARFRHAGERWVVETDAGRVTADALVLATNAYTEAFEPGLAPDIANEFVPILSWQMATQPLGANVRGAVIPGRQAVSDTHGDLHFYRYDARGRLITGGALMVPLRAEERLKDRIAARILRSFPQVGEVRFDHVWNGAISMTPDYLPRVHRLGPGGYAYAGCNGRGIALAFSIGPALAKAALGTPESELPLPIQPVRGIPLRGILRHLAPLKLVEYRWRDAREIA